MSDPLANLVAGEFSPFVTSSATINAALDAIRRVRRTERGTSGGSPELDPALSALAVFARNGTGGDLPEFSVVRLGGSVTSPTVAPLSFQEQPLFEGLVPAGSGDAFGILTVPLGAGATGRAIVQGVAVCDLVVNDPNHGYAVPMEGVTETLESAASGPARILEKAGTSGTVRAVVLLQGGSGGCSGESWFDALRAGDCIRIRLLDGSAAPVTLTSTDGETWTSATPIEICGQEYLVTWDRETEDLTLTSTGVEDSGAPSSFRGKLRCATCATATFSFRRDQICSCEPRVAGGICANLLRLRMEWVPCFTQSTVTGCCGGVGLPAYICATRADGTDAIVFGPAPGLEGTAWKPIAGRNVTAEGFYRNPEDGLLYITTLLCQHGTLASGGTATWQMTQALDEVGDPEFDFRDEVETGNENIEPECLADAAGLDRTLADVATEEDTWRIRTWTPDGCDAPPFLPGYTGPGYYRIRTTGSDGPGVVAHLDDEQACDATIEICGIRYDSAEEAAAGPACNAEDDPGGPGEGDPGEPLPPGTCFTFGALTLEPVGESGMLWTASDADFDYTLQSHTWYLEKTSKTDPTGPLSCAWRPAPGSDWDGTGSETFYRVPWVSETECAETVELTAVECP